MNLRRNKSEKPVEQGPTPYEIGLHRTVEDFYAADKAAKEDLAGKKAAFKKSKKAYENWNPLGRKKYLADQDAYRAAQNVPSQIQAGFYLGACEAFQDGRPDNIQHILSAPKEFGRYNSLHASDTLITLLSDSPNPDTVPDKALAEVAKDERQDVLDSALFNVVRGGYADVEKLVSALLKAGADASYQSNVVLAMALRNDVPAEVAGLLIEYKANLDEALQGMRNNRTYYGATPEKIEALQCKDDEIRELKETIAELTGKPEKPDAATPAPAKATDTRIKLKVSTAGPH